MKKPNEITKGMLVFSKQGNYIEFSYKEDSNYYHYITNKNNKIFLDFSLKYFIGDEKYYLNGERINFDE